ncbi:MAG: MFS transporter [Spirirestis rafaelensis WJT71-NPBG6]|jgi:MFS family permease|nr:MFS transporter [Spirirestis rafaelensis WJT71-NPBG6]
MEQIIKSKKSTSLFDTKLIALYIISFLTGVSLGFFNPLISTFMEQQQIDGVWIGANSTIYFLTIALVTPFVEKSLRRNGIRRIMIFGLLLTGFSASLFPLTTQLPLWFIIRIVMGVGVCCLLIAGQTALNNFSHESNRTSVSGIYSLALGVGFGIGPIIGPRIYVISPQLAFIVGGAAILSALPVVWYWLPKKFAISLPSAHFLTKTAKKLKFSLHGVFCYGFAEAALISLYPLFLLRQNYSLEQMGNTFSLFVVGSIIGTLPVTYLADRSGKVKILSINLLIGLLSCLGLVLVNQYEFILLFSFMAGASIGPLYPLCLALVGEQLPKQELAAGTALFTTIYSLGCASGPILSSIMMETLGNRNLFSLCIPLYTILLLRIALKRKNFRKRK